jgi:hypothetical protein
MPFITVNASGPDIPDGVYPVVLADIVGPRTVTAQRGPKAGQDIDLYDWLFHVDQPGTKYDQQEISVSSSTASGPRSKMYAFLTALFGGVAPPVGSSFEKDQIIGRHALATLQKDEEGWLRIVNLGALPTNWGGAGTPAAQQAAPAAPAEPAPAQDAAFVSPLKQAEDATWSRPPAREAVAGSAGDPPLPF